MRVALAQVDCQLGNVQANLDDAESMVHKAADQEAELVVFPELSLHGYALGALSGDHSVGIGDQRLAQLSRLGSRRPAVLGRQ